MKTQLLLACLLLCGCGPVSSPAEPEADADAKLAEICKASAADLRSANLKYKGETLTVRGTVHSADADHFDGSSAILEAAIGHCVLVLWFVKEARDEVAALKKGDSVSVRGTVDGMDAREFKGAIDVTVQLLNCTFERESTPDR